MLWKMRVDQLMQERGWNQFDLADASGYRQPHISRILKRDDLPSHKTLERLATAFSVSVEYLTSGINRPAQTEQVPILQPSQISLWLSAPDTLREKITDWLSPGLTCSHQTYAMHVTANDMTGPVWHYPMNALVIVDPEKNLEPGYRIVCEKNGHTIFRELQVTAGEYYLVSLNTAYPAIHLGKEFSANYLGRVIATLIKDQA